MSSFMGYILESTVCISVLNVLFRLLLRKKSIFAFNRILLVSIILTSSLIPLMPLPFHAQPAKDLIFTSIRKSRTPIIIQPTDKSPSNNSPVNTNDRIHQGNINISSILHILYIAGIIVSVLLSLCKIASLLFLVINNKSQIVDKHKVLILNHNIPSFAFWHFIFISKEDYYRYGQVILVHEQAHIRLCHFIDIFFIELTRAFHWFNPFVHMLTRDLKDIHEFQADQQVLSAGIDPIQYKFLLIQKSVGHKKFMLANYFSQHQIKKRITMMNSQKTNAVWHWNMLYFIPVIAILLMAFGNPAKDKTIEKHAYVSQSDSTIAKKWCENDFGKISRRKREDMFFSGQPFVHILMNFRGQIMIREKLTSISAIQDSLRNYLSFSTRSGTQSHTNVHAKIFKENGKNITVSLYTVLVNIDIGVPTSERERLLSVIGNTWDQIREEYSLELYNSEYSKINESQRKRLDEIIPLPVYILTPNKDSE